MTGALPSEIAEASGVAVSRRNPGILWVHNDDDPAILFGIDSTGMIHGRVRVRGIKNADWEDIAVAKCGDSTCLYIGDIGDNRHERNYRNVYRIAEPSINDTEATNLIAYPFVLPGRSDDAEALFVHEQRLYLITKGRRGSITLFRFPEPLTSVRPVELEPIMALSGGLVQLPDMVTGAGTTPNDQFIVVRTYSALQIYRLENDQLIPVLERAFDLHAQHEFQGEGVDIRDDGVAWLVSEKGLSDAPPPITRVQCRLPAN
ncbi:MAG TPA: hypothetical protein VM100_00810 [Longimicrobiales bacterium]|nr:hypothetical protein [Longimicrobiales bacterium]